MRDGMNDEDNSYGGDDDNDDDGALEQQQQQHKTGTVRQWPHVGITWTTWKSHGTRGNRVVHVTQLIRHPLKAFSLFAFLFSFSSLISWTRTIVLLRLNFLCSSRRSLPLVPDRSASSWSAYYPWWKVSDLGMLFLTRGVTYTQYHQCLCVYPPCCVVFLSVMLASVYNIITRQLPEIRLICHAKLHKIYAFYVRWNRQWYTISKAEKTVSSGSVRNGTSSKERGLQ